MYGERLYLAGFMGSGKTSVGEILARLLNLPFTDLDQMIESREGIPVAQLFAEKGEPYFRRAEAECLSMTADSGAAVIALGGGTFVDLRNRHFIEEHGVSIWLKVSLETACRRLAGDGTRPLFQSRDAVERLYLDRLGAYSPARLHISTDLRTPENVAHDIIRVMETL